MSNVTLVNCAGKSVAFNPGGPATQEALFIATINWQSNAGGGNGTCTLFTDGTGAALITGGLGFIGRSLAGRLTKVRAQAVSGRSCRAVAERLGIPEGDTVVLSAPTVPAPVAVRYGWGDDPLCNLVNRAGLPAVPFRTDRWPRLTAGRQLP